MSASCTTIKLIKKLYKLYRWEREREREEREREREEREKKGEKEREGLSIYRVAMNAYLNFELLVLALSFHN